MVNGKVYKLVVPNIPRIFPGDPTGLPDDFFLLNNFYAGGLK